MTAVRRALLDRGGLLALLVVLAYAWSASPFVVDPQSAELSLAGAIGRAAHATAHPLTVLWLRAWSWLPASSPAHAAALATALLGGLGALALHAACRAWGARPLAATAAVAIYAAGPGAVQIATAANAFAMTQVVVACALWLAATAGPAKGARRVIAIAAVVGLGLASAATWAVVAVLCVVGVLGVVRGLREVHAAGGSRARAVVAGVAALIVGLAPYAYLLASAPISAWGEPTFGNAGPWRLLHSADVPANLVAWLGSFARGWLYVPAVLGVAWLARSCVRGDVAKPGAGDTVRECMWSWRALALVLVVAGPVLAATLDTPPGGLGSYATRPVHALSLALLAPAIAVVLDRLLERAYVPRLLGSPLAHLAFLFALAPTLPAMTTVHGRANETGIANLLRSLPQGAVVVQASGELHYGAAYLQREDGLRPDVVVVTWPLAAQSWYRDELAARGVTLPAGDDEAIAIAALVAAGKPVVIDPFDPGAMPDLPTFAYGIVWRVLPRGASAPTEPEQLAIEQAVFDAFDVDYAQPHTGDGYAAAMHERYASVWWGLAAGVAAAGRPELSDDAVAYAHRIGPQ